MYAAVVIGNAFHVGGVLPVGDALFIQGAAAQDEACMGTHAIWVLYYQSVSLFSTTSSTRLSWTLMVVKSICIYDGGSPMALGGQRTAAVSPDGVIFHTTLEKLSSPHIS